MSEVSQIENKSEKGRPIPTQSLLEHAAKFTGWKGGPQIRNVNQEFEDKLTFGQRLADSIAATMGSWRFIIIQSTILATWIILNSVALINHWDPYPFILLNLALSFQAAYAAPVIMMSQNRQADKDRLAAQNDFEVNKRGEVETRAVLLHLEQQDRFMVEILERLDHLTGDRPVSSANGKHDHSVSVGEPVSQGEAGLEQSHVQQISSELDAELDEHLVKPSLTPQEVRDLLGRCYIKINLESFRRNNLMSLDEMTDGNMANVFNILYREAFLVVEANYEQPTASDLNRVRDLLVTRLKYGAIDPALVQKYTNLSQALISKLAQ